MTFTYAYKEGIDYLLENEKASDITLYTGYGEGAYPEWMGIKCYIDPRAEVFFKENNKKEDIIEEYFSLQKEHTIEVKDFLEKYKFSHLLVPEDDYLYENMDDIDNYEIIYEGISLNEYSFINTNSNEKLKYRIYKRIS